jgi:hypothetical protein
VDTLLEQGRPFAACGGDAVLLRCLLDGLLLPACFLREMTRLVAFDGAEGFPLEALEARYYEVVSATEQEWLFVERVPYRLLRRAADFRWDTGAEKS